MTLAATLPSQRRSLDDEIAGVRDEVLAGQQATRATIERMHRAWVAYQQARSTSETDFLRAATPDFERPNGTINGKYVDWLNAGHAWHAGRTETRISEAALLGRAHRKHGLTWAQVDALLQKGGHAALRTHLSKRGATSTTTRRLTDTAAARLDAIVSDLRKVRGAPQDDLSLRSLAVELPTVLPFSLVQASLQAVQTGDRTALDDLAAAVRHEDLISYWKRAHGCLVCAARAHTHAHHLRIGENTARGNTYLVVLCDAHHIPRPGGTDDVAHSRAWVGRHFGTFEALALRREAIILAYSAHVAGSETEDPA